MRFYITSASNMPLGAGYVEVEADDRDHARNLAFQYMPDGRWSFDYKALDDVHPMDRVCRGYIAERTGFRSTKEEGKLPFESCMAIPTDLSFIGLKYALEAYQAKKGKPADTVYYSQSDARYILQIQGHTNQVGLGLKWVLMPEYPNDAWSVGVEGDLGCGSEGA